MPEIGPLQLASPTVENQEARVGPRDVGWPRCVHHRLSELAALTSVGSCPWRWLYEEVETG